MIDRAVLVLVCLAAIGARAADTEGDKPTQTSGRKTFWDRKHHRVEHFGNAVLVQEGESMTADYVMLDKDQRTLDARGNCVYVTSDAVMYGESMHFNLDSRLGIIHKGRVVHSSFSLSGEEIRKVDTGRYLITKGEFTTCRDCPQSWTFLGDEIDATFDGYAFIRGVTFKVRDVPVGYAPYLILPLKKKRESGFLFPPWGVDSRYGWMLFLPYFWAAHRSADMTFWGGFYANRGPRGAWEGRYALTPLSYGNAKVHFIRDHESVAVNASGIRNRWGLLLQQSQELPYGIGMRLQLAEVGDNLYPQDFPTDLDWDYQNFLASNLVFVRSDRHFYAGLAFRRIRTLGYREPDPFTSPTPQNPSPTLPTGFNPTTIQLTPGIYVSTPERPVLDSPISAGVSATAFNFTRALGPFDCEDPASALCGTSASSPVYTPGVDPIRETQRVSLLPTLSTSFKPTGVLTVSPSFKYRGFYYRFPSESQVKPLARGYLLFQNEISTQVERFFETSDRDYSKLKHTIRPWLTYSLIPYRHEPDSHPLLAQIDRNPANKFDNYDIVPYDSPPINDYKNYFVPLGHSLTYGARTQLMAKPASAKATYGSVIVASVAQTVNFREYKRQRPQAFSRLESNVGTGYGPIGLEMDYYYYPYWRELTGRNPHEVYTKLKWVFPGGGSRLDLALARYLLLMHVWDKGGANSMDIEFVYSLFGFFVPKLRSNYNLVTKKVSGLSSELTFQSASECWRLNMGVSRGFAPTDQIAVGASLDLNFTGKEFSNVSGLPQGLLSQ